MKSHELAKILLEGPDVPLLVDSYEDGYDVVVGIGEVSQHTITDNVPWYYGIIDTYMVTKEMSSEDAKRLSPLLACVLRTTRDNQSNRTNWLRSWGIETTEVD